MFDVKTEKNNVKSKAKQQSWKPIKTTLDEALTVSTPSWPLQNTVAVNPFWFRREQKFEDVISDLYKVIHKGLYMPVEYYLERYANGEISQAGLQSSLTRLSKKWPGVPSQIGEFLKISQTERLARQKFKSLGDYLDEKFGVGVSKLLSAETSRYAAAYLDSRQALAAYPWRDQDFLSGWLEASQFDQSIESQGLCRLSAVTAKIKSKKAPDVIGEIFELLAISDAQCQRHILERMAVSVLGWMSQFKYVEWQKSLGYAMESRAEAADLLAVRLIYELAAYESYKTKYPSAMDAWRTQVIEFEESVSESAHRTPVELVWQAAFEESYQKHVASDLYTGPLTTQDASSGVDAQIAFCIDVRSEMIRRHIEATDGRLSTIGFAGFFGVAMDYKKIDEKEVGHRCPVLLTPALTVKETSKDQGHKDVSRKITRKLTLSYFKALRKAPLSSFAYVEMLGILALKPMITRTLRSMAGQRKVDKVPGRFNSVKYTPDMSSCSPMSGGALSADDLAGRAAGILKHMGLRSGFAPLVIVAGHGSHTTNNAFGSALDCGACGGHAGDVNARVLVELLNDQKVRDGLPKHGINLPKETHFVAAVHETVTDDVYLLDEESIPAAHRKSAERIKQSLALAASRARVERQGARSQFMADPAARRAINWSEVRPEWALAGNACFIVAPRMRSKGMNLGSRSFLHDYEYTKDEGYGTLELIMTAPMVVTNWINLQYFASTVAPDVYGAGNKVLHNVVNECGVVEGNGGDLRVGLPLQSVHDGSKFVHDPLRLSVFIEAPRDAMEAIINKHQVVRDLVDNEWLYLLQINRDDGLVYVRRPGGVYESVS
jgi:uncharacterized protein YbcC (UPF0753/DUF2309 family)